MPRKMTDRERLLAAALRLPKAALGEFIADLRIIQEFKSGELTQPTVQKKRGRPRRIGLPQATPPPMEAAAPPVKRRGRRPRVQAASQVFDKTA